METSTTKLGVDHLDTSMHGLILRVNVLFKFSARRVFRHIGMDITLINTN